MKTCKYGCGGKMKSGGKVTAVKKMAKGGYAPAQTGGDNTKMGIYGIPNAGRTDALGFKKGGAVKKAKLAAMAPPKGKITRADIITAAKRNAKKKKYGEGGPTTKSNTTPMEQSSQPNTPPVGTNKLTGNPRFKTGGRVAKKKK